MTYRIITIPKLDERMTEHDQLALAHKFREFRLLALKTAPGAYASSYEDEAKRGLDHTFERLRHAKATQFVALASSAFPPTTNQVREADIDDLLNHDWLGFIVLIGLEGGLGSVSAKADPFSQIARDSSSNGTAQEMHSNDAMRFHLNGMFVSPSARRCGMGARLIEAALDRSRLMSEKSSYGLHCTIIVDEWNHAAIKLYQRVGFEIVAKESYGEDRIALRMELSRVGAAGGGVAACADREAHTVIS
jgi:ribosomal protein S18 acetylase RimI-like enzyme